MTMTMIVVNKHVDGADCCLIGIILCVIMIKNLPITILSNICKCQITQYQYCSNLKRNNNVHIYVPP